MKKVFGAAVLLVFLVNTMGYYVVFQVRRDLARKEMFARMRQGVLHPDMVTLKIIHPENCPDFRRIEKSEFSYHGKLYDVVVEHKTGDTTVFCCLRDHKEETILAGLNRVLDHGANPLNPSRNNPLRNLLNHLITVALPEQSQSLQVHPGEDCSFPVIRQSVITAYHPPLSPPPEVA